MILINSDGIIRELVFTSPHFDNYNKTILLNMTKMTQVYDNGIWKTITDSYIQHWKQHIITNDITINKINGEKVIPTEYVEKKLTITEFPSDDTLSFFNNINNKVYKKENETFVELTFVTGDIIKINDTSEYLIYSGNNVWDTILTMGERDYLIHQTFKQMGGHDIDETIYNVMSAYIDSYLIKNNIVKGFILE